MNISRKRALGFHKNNKRIWLEGVVLENAGLSAGGGLLLLGCVVRVMVVFVT